MKKITLLFILAFVASSLCAQINRTIATQNPTCAEQFLFGEKGPSYRLLSRESNDNFEQINFHYDAQGRIVAVESLCVEDDPLIDSIVYNENNQVIQINGWQNLHSAQWIHAYIVNYEYDQNGRMIHRTNFNSLGTETMTQGGVYDYSYNADGNIVAHEGYMGDYDVVFESATYFYDEQKRLVRQEILNGYGYLDSSLLNTYTYNDAGLLATHTSYYFADPGWDLDNVDTYEYDEHGNCIEHSLANAYGDYVDRRFYHYNTNVSSQNVVMPYFIPELDYPEAFNDANQRLIEEWWTVDDNQVLQYVCDFDYVYDNLPDAIQDVEATELSVYPVPASNVLNVELTQAATVFVYNAEGRLLQSSVLNEGAQSLNVSGFASGVYFMNVRYNDGSMARSKFVKE